MLLCVDAMVQQSPKLADTVKVIGKVPLSRTRIALSQQVRSLKPKNLSIRIRVLVGPYSDRSYCHCALEPFTYSGYTTANLALILSKLNLNPPHAIIVDR